MDRSVPGPTWPSRDLPRLVHDSAPMPLPTIALLTERRFTAHTAPPQDWYLANVLHEDHLLQAALLRRGIASRRVDWARADVDWSDFDGAVFRSTWDYSRRFGEFQAWLDRVAGLLPLCNPLPVIRWNADKHYLADLEAAGIPVVPTRFLERGTDAPLPELLGQSGWPEAVVKPCVSGGARHTYRVNPGNAADLDPLLRGLLREEAFLLQPFQDTVLAGGEDTLMVMGGRYTHAVRKRPKAGDFRVQDDHGGSVERLRPEAAQVDLAERAMAACPADLAATPPAYGRVDLVRDNDGRWVVMELELFEPELWLRQHPPAAEAMVEAAVGILAGAGMRAMT